MSKLTATQHATLVWLDKIGGTCIAYGEKVCYPPDARSTLTRNRQVRHHEHPMMPAVSALHLVQRGAIEARAGQLHITEYGRRLVRP